MDTIHGPNITLRGTANATGYPRKPSLNGRASFVDLLLLPTNP
jgi:hypothetical protein